MSLDSVEVISCAQRLANMVSFITIPPRDNGLLWSITVWSTTHNLLFYTSHFFFNSPFLIPIKEVFFAAWQWKEYDALPSHACLFSKQCMWWSWCGGFRRMVPSLQKILFPLFNQGEHRLGGAVARPKEEAGCSLISFLQFTIVFVFLCLEFW